MRTLEYENGPSISPLLDGEMWEVTEDWRITIRGEAAVVPKGFVTDGASIPRILWRICGHPMSTQRINIAIVHDAIYGGEITGYTRKEADEIYRDALIEQGWPKWKANTEYITLRLCGGSHWMG